MSQKKLDFQTSWNLHFSPLEPKTSSLFWLDTSMYIAFTGQLYDKLIQQAKNFVRRFLIFADCGHLQAFKARDLKLLCLSQLCGLKDQKIKVGF
jgi:hypothetical protein